MSSPKGFTLLELLLSMAIIAILAAIAIPFYSSYQTKNDFQLAAETIAQSLWRAETLARAMQHDDSWGVHVETGSITLFKGTDYAVRDTDFDEQFGMPSNIVVSGATDQIFAKFSGLPTTPGEIVIESPTHELKTVTVNGRGMVNY